MSDGKLYFLAEFVVKPELLEETKGIFSRLLPTVLKEEGCEALYTTSIVSEPDKLVLFEIFSSQGAHDWHMAQAYTQQLAVDLEGNLLHRLRSRNSIGSNGVGSALGALVKESDRLRCRRAYEIDPLLVQGESE